MKRNFMPGMILLTVSIEPGDSTDILIGGDEDKSGQYWIPETGEIYFFDGEVWYTVEGEPLSGKPSGVVPYEE